MRYTWTTKQFLPIGEKLGEKGISAARAESISAARFLPGGQKRANTGQNIIWLNIILLITTNWSVTRVTLVGQHKNHLFFFCTFS